ncbi:hypothetical protein BGZ83_005878 [Gryganskiella cystojenkinii]|nr:hypothetical protein BGZ83_005878 [Gryganskiella cystojenkinii]
MAIRQTALQYWPQAIIVLVSAVNISRSLYELYESVKDAKKGPDDKDLQPFLSTAILQWLLIMIQIQRSAASLQKATNLVRVALYVFWIEYLAKGLQWVMMLFAFWEKISNATSSTGGNISDAKDEMKLGVDDGNTTDTTTSPGAATRIQMFPPSDAPWWFSIFAGVLSILFILTPVMVAFALRTELTRLQLRDRVLLKERRRRAQSLGLVLAEDVDRHGRGVGEKASGNDWEGSDDDNEDEEDEVPLAGANGSLSAIRSSNRAAARHKRLMLLRSWPRIVLALYFGLSVTVDVLELFGVYGSRDFSSFSNWTKLRVAFDIIVPSFGLYFVLYRQSVSASGILFYSLALEGLFTLGKFFYSQRNVEFTYDSIAEFNTPHPAASTSDTSAAAFSNDDPEDKPTGTTKFPIALFFLMSIFMILWYVVKLWIVRSVMVDLQNRQARVAAAEAAKRAKTRTSELAKDHEKTTFIAFRD